MKPFQKLSPSLRAAANRIGSSFAEIMDLDPATWRDEQRTAVVQAMTNIHADATGRQMSDSEQQLWNAAKSAVHVHDNTIVRTFCRDANGNPQEIGREDRRGSDDPFGSTPSAGAWRSSDGREVRVFNRDERVAATSHDYHGVSFGGLVRSMVTGPRTEGERRALSEGSSSAGGVTVATPLAQEFIDLLRAKTCCIRAGARTVPMDSATLKIAKMTADVPGAWRSENASIAAGDPTFTGVTLTAQSLSGMVVCSRELLQDSINADQMLAQAFAGKMAVLLDAACLVGTGVSPMPAGLAAISGVNQESMGTNGLALTSFSELLDLRLALDAANAAAPTAWIMAPRTAATIAAFADSNGQWLNPPAWLNNSGTFGDGGKPPLWLTSTSVPVNQVQGSASNASSIYTGDFTQMLVGVRETLRLEVLPQLYANEGKIALVAHMRADVALTRAADFGRLVGIIP